MAFSMIVSIVSKGCVIRLQSAKEESQVVELVCGKIKKPMSVLQSTWEKNTEVLNLISLSWIVEELSLKDDSRGIEKSFVN